MHLLSVIITGVLLVGGCALRTREEWNNLFVSDAKKVFASDEHFVAAHTAYHEASRKTLRAKSLNSQERHSYVLQFTPKCSHCHESLQHFVQTTQSSSSIISTNHIMVHMTPNHYQQLLSSHTDLIAASVPLLPVLKIDSNVVTTNDCADSAATSEYLLTLMPLSDVEITQFLSNLNALVTLYDISYDAAELQPHARVSMVSVRVPCISSSAVLPLLSSIPAVTWIETRFPTIAYNKWAPGIVQMGIYNGIPMTAANLTAENEIIGVADSGIDAYTCFMYDADTAVPYNTINMNHRKIIKYDTFVDAEDGSGHGTTVSAIAAGVVLDSTHKASEYNAPASSAKISFIDLGSGDSSSLTTPTNSYSRLYQSLYDSGARIMSMSWGTTSNRYNTDSRNVDQFMNDYPDSLILFAAGNSGGDGENTVGSPATNKNGVAVGASLNDEESWKSISAGGQLLTNKDTLAGFSSKGPTEDGRLKPDVCAPGWYITSASYVPSSTAQHCSAAPGRGTSFSTPLLAANAAMVRQFFLDGFYPSGERNISDSFVPSGALIKAALIHGAQELSIILNDDGSSSTTSKGDVHQGYGRSQLNESLSFSESTLDGLNYFVIGSATSATPSLYRTLTTNEEHTYEFTTVDEDDLQPIRVTLAYTDTPGTVGSSNILIHNLDVTLSNTTHTFYPLVSNSGNRDTKNNVEVIVLHTPVRNSEYTVTVSADTIVGSQPYALIISGNMVGYNYTVPKVKGNKGDVGLSDQAKIAIAVMTILAFTLIACVYWIGFHNAKKRPAKPLPKFQPQHVPANVRDRGRK